MSNGSVPVSSLVDGRNPFSSSGVFSSLEGVVLHRCRKSSWNGDNPDLVPYCSSSCLDLGNDEDLNASIGELTVQGVVKGVACVNELCGVQKEVLNEGRALLMDSGVHSR